MHRMKKGNYDGCSLNHQFVDFDTRNRGNLRCHIKIQTNTRQYIIRVKVQSKQNHPKRLYKGMKKCGDNCTECSHVRKRKLKILKILPEP